jgi:phosphoglycerate kinase
MNLRQYTKSDIDGKRVLLRLDLDVEVNEQGEVDQYHDLRLRRATPTIKQLLDFRAKRIVMLGHRGRPPGKDENFSLRPVAARLQTLLQEQGINEPLKFVDDIAAVSTASDSGLVMLENLRFWPGEKGGDAVFTKTLAQWGEVYINDAFGASHRPDVSLSALPTLVSQAFAGPNLFLEVEHLSSFLTKSASPFIVVLGGIKISTKLPLIQALLPKADKILLGGGLANTVLASRGQEVGRSVIEDDMLQQARKLSREKIVVPTDFVVSSDAGQTDVKELNELLSSDFIGDIGPETTYQYCQEIAKACSILWNGPMGKYEQGVFRASSAAVASAIAENSGKTLVGGGDTVPLLAELNLITQFGFVSCGGGAMLAFLAGGEMPGLKVISL